MKANLDHLRREILTLLEERGLVVFKSYPRGPELGSDSVYWDTETYPDHREFIAAAKALGARMMTIYSREFSTELIDDALAQLAHAGLERDERRLIEGRLKEFRAYEGFVCQLELSFTDGHRTYVFDQPTEWYEEMEQLIDEIEESFEGPVDETPLGGYYSNN
jgi:hypothetical protein